MNRFPLDIFLCQALTELLQVHGHHSRYLMLSLLDALQRNDAIELRYNVIPAPYSVDYGRYREQEWESCTFYSTKLYISYLS